MYPSSGQHIHSHPHQLYLQHKYNHTPSSSRKVTTVPLLQQQASPHHQKQSFDTSPLLQQQHSPKTFGVTSNYLSANNLKTQRNLFPPLPPQNMEKGLESCNELGLEPFSSTNRDQQKPKIVFSYSKKGSLQVANNTLPSSCGTAKNKKFVDKVNVG